MPKETETQDAKMSVDDALRADVYRARKAEEAIYADNSVMKPITRQRMAQNLGSIINLAKASGVQKSEIVIKAKVRQANDKFAVNALNTYCILPDSRRQSAPRLTARPKNYLALALAVADLLQMKGHRAVLSRHQAILMLVENTNRFEGDTGLTEKAFSPAQIVLDSLMIKLSYLSRKHKLEDYFREVQESSVTYDLHRRASENAWARNRWSETSIGHWPRVLLTSVVRSAARVTMQMTGMEGEVDGELLVVDSVFLTLGWDLQSRVIAWLEFQPALVANPQCTHPKAPWTEYDNSSFCKYFEVSPKGSVGIFKYKFKEGEKLAFTFEQDFKRWPDAASSTRARFERLTATSLGRTFSEGRTQYIRDQGLCPHVEILDVVAPPSSALAYIEAVLLDRNSTEREKKVFSFIDGLEKEVIKLTTSFREWKATSVKRASMDHDKMRAETLLAIERLQTEHSQEDDTER
ncbi:hypothetical protein JK185_14040 [Gluconobacter wancherniae]|nr:hypothetical protein [Gluconobacter wancherniae]